MDKVGNQGKGESVWLAFFLHKVLIQFSALARKKEDEVYAKHCEDQAKRINGLIDESAWDGAWYKRAYFDDGSALGAAINAECQIDSISQSWSVLASAGNPAHRKQAMESLYRRLVNKEKGIIQLLDPPFDQSEQNPGYIRGYVPGVRENGGQYTHAAIWAGMAFAMQGKVDHAWEAFDIINPINHGNTAAAIKLYKVEPYVMAADVYGVAPHSGRGGWTWYTGSAGWMYTFIIESLLGIHRRNTELSITPCLRFGWSGYQLDYRYCDTIYHIDVTMHDDPMHTSTLYIDGKLSEDLHIELVDDKQLHQLRLEIPRSPVGANQI